MSTLYLDLETYSEADLSSCGAYVYARHPSTEVLLFAYALDNAPVRLWDCMADPDMPDDLARHLADPDVVLVAHNAQFDRWVIEHVLRIRPALTRWRCTMAKAYTVGLPGKLEQLGAALGLADDLQKLREGARLIRLFSVPQRPRIRRRQDETQEEFEARYAEQTTRATAETHPEDWERFREYAIRDVESLREIDRRLPGWNYQGEELALWHLDQKINDRGLPVDLKLARLAAKLCDAEQDRLNAELSEITDGAVMSHSRRDAVMAWIRSRGVDITGYTKADVSGLLERPDLPADVRRVLEIRQEAGRTSTAKYVAFARVTDPEDRRIRGAFQYAGASRTMRWAGRMVQPQNFPRPTIDDTDTAAEAVLNGTAELLYDNLMEVGASVVRSVIAAPKGRTLVAGDYSNIEGRVLAWLAGEEWKLQAFRDFDAGIGHDIYKQAYSRTFGVPVESVTADQRQVGKVEELAFGYQGSVGAFRQFGDAFGVGKDMTDEEILVFVRGWRQGHPATVSWWYELEEAAVRAVRNPGKAFRARKVVYKVQRYGKNVWLLCRLPSGRFLTYYAPRLTHDGCLQYEGLDQKTRRWVVEDSYGGKLAENCTQAVARDLMAANMPHVERAGFEIIGTVHDEIITEVPEGSPTHGAADLERAMTFIPPWAEGMPLVAGAYTSRRYRKG